MKIHDRILLAFLGLGVAIGVAAYVSLSLSQRTLIESIGKHSVELANTTMNHVYDSIQQRLEALQCNALPLGEHSILSESNTLFDQEEDVNDLILPLEEAWTKNDPTGRISDIASNPLSTSLANNIECSDYYVKKYGHVSFGEVFVTNKHGANVAQTAMTSDYFQADELWWQHAKDYGTYVGQIQYDESTGLYAVDLVIRLDDKAGNFAGILKAVYNVRQLTSILESVKYGSVYDSTRLRLMTGDQIIFDTRRALPAASLKPAIKQQIVDTEAGYGHFQLADQKALVAFYSGFYSDRPGTLDTTLILSYDTSEILAPTAILKAQFITVTIMLIACSTIGGVVLAKSISKPLLSLKNMAFNISCGDLNTSSRINATGEIGELAESFDRMTHDLRYTLDNLQSEIRTRQDAEAKLAFNNHKLTHMLEELERVNQELKSFAHVASHDLREPLRKIVMSGNILQESLSGQISSDDEECLEYMVDGASRMTHLISALLTHSQMGGIDDLFEPVDMDLLVQEIQKYNLAQLIEETGTLIETPDPLPEILGDPIQLSRLFQNIISNAIKFQRESDTPVITIESHSVYGGMACIEVQDNGIGIAAEDYEDIFTMFKRLHTGDEFEGTGIGLATCKKIVDHHGGSIRVESPPGQGSRFFITLPKAKKTNTDAASHVEHASA
ncbi:MAG: HAMP domain-containing protein [Phycisphaeraceae bacterium]|nr:HAMP domain-containing protein [Phycisphaeraceae bacterium]